MDGRHRGSGRGRGTFLLTLSLACAAFAVAAPEIRAQAVPDSLQREIESRLQRLGRTLGDSTGVVEADSTVAQDERRAPRLSPPGSDSTVRALMALPGYDLTQYQGEGAQFETGTRVLTLSGAEGRLAVLNRQGVQLTADSALIFDERTGRLVTVGAEAIYTPETGDEVTTRRIIFDLDENRGTADDAQTEYAQGTGNWIVRGDFPWVNPNVSYGHDVRFTSCELEEPHYHFASGEIKVVPGGTMVAKNVVLYFADVPVFWLPFIAQSTETGRRSGLLPVRFSVNDIVRTSSSYSRRISNLGYYWAMSDYTDAELGLDWWSGNYTALTGSFRYRWLRQFLNGDITYRQYWQEDGGNQIAFDTRHNWEISERTQLSIDAGYVSSASFVTQNSFDPREVTQSIDSNVGLNHRFGWGNLSVNGSRRQYLNDERVELNFPTVSLSMSTITLFPAPANRAGFFNNMTLSASGQLSNALIDRATQDPSGEFMLSLTDQETRRGRLSTTLSLGNLSVNQSVGLDRLTRKDVPADYFLTPDPLPSGVGSVGQLQRGLQALPEPGIRDFGDEELTWSTRISYQQTLIGSTSITPNLSISGRSVRADTSVVAEDRFIAAPNRISFGAALKTDVYGFYGGFGGFDRLRHKFSPTFDYSFTPETTPTPLQQEFFGASAINPRNEIRIGLNQTLEASVRGDEDEDSASAATDPAGNEPQRLEVSEKVTLLGLQTSVVTYDFEQASQFGDFKRGFADNLTLSNSIKSDFLRGLSLSVDHDIFDDSGLEPDGTGERVFDPHLSSLRMSFALSDRSALFRWIRGLTGDVEPEPEEEEDPLDPTGLETADLGESTIVPGLGGRDRDQERQRQTQGRVGTWNASLSYSLSRPRNEDLAATQMLSGTVRFQPTEKWSVNWRTSYDIELNRFNDHIISLQRDLHRWEADFSFRQTATGNWSFMFEVALSDNRDLHFDYQQRSVDQFR